MKKTLIITLEYPPIVGGIATFIDQMAQSFPAEKVVVLAPAHKEAEAWDERRTFTIVRRKLLFPSFIWPRWIRLFWQVYRIVRKEQIEALHIHHVLPVGYIAFLIKKFFKIPFLLFSHGTDIAAAAQKPWKRKMALRVSQEAEQIILNSENLKRRLVNAFPELAEMSSVMYPCPNPEFFDPVDPEEIQKMRSMYALEGKKVILSVSRLTTGKGFMHMIRLMPEIFKQAPHLVWFIVGDGDKSQTILREIQKNNLQNIVRFIGEIPHHQLRSYYHLADLFVLLTHPHNGQEEGLGLVFLEAAAAGLPIVAGRSGGVDEAVDHGQTGLIVDVYQNPQGIVKAIGDLLTYEDYADQLGKAGQERIRSHFQWEHQLTRIEAWL